MQLDLKIGKQYVTRERLVTSPLAASNHLRYAFEAWVWEPEFADPTWATWLISGHFLTPMQNHKLDLVKEFEPQ